MSRYRKVAPRFWKDEKVVTFNRDEKLIALYLFTSGQSNRVGLFSFSPAGAAEDLGISLDTFAKSFMEPFGKVIDRLHLGWDPVARVLWLPTWWKYNCPENPNVLKACLGDLIEVPQTPLIAEFSSHLKYLPETFHQTFREGLPKPSPKPCPNQEQEQEQEQEKKQENIIRDLSPTGISAARPKRTRADSPGDPRVKSLIESFAAKFEAKVGKAYLPVWAKDSKLLKAKLTAGESSEEIKNRMDLFFADPSANKTGFDIGRFVASYNRLNLPPDPRRVHAEPGKYKHFD